jgi:short-subunit dehydrogenase
MSTILITGASSGIGRATAETLARGGHRLLITGREPARLAEVTAACGDRVDSLVADLTTVEGRHQVIRAATDNAVDPLINNAGINELVPFEQMAETDIARMIEANVTAPLSLTRGLLPHLQGLDAARIVNVGSTFGTIGFPGYVVYSTTKFALRGFSEALRRELADSRIVVQYIAPRATRTPLNSGRADAMNAALGNAVDDPADVAASIARILDRGPGDYYLGWPEKLFARINAIAPKVVTRALRGQLGTIRRYAETEGSGSTAPSPGH